MKNILVVFIINSMYNFNNFSCVISINIYHIYLLLCFIIKNTYGASLPKCKYFIALYTILG